MGTEAETGASCRNSIFPGFNILSFDPSNAPTCAFVLDTIHV